MSDTQAMVDGGTLARLCGRLAADDGEPVTACPHAAGGRRTDWLRGWLEQFVSQKSDDSAVSGLSHVKQAPRRGRPDWSSIDDAVLEIGCTMGMGYADIGAVIRRGPVAVRIRACRLGLARSRSRSQKSEAGNQKSEGRAA